MRRKNDAMRLTSDEKKGILMIGNSCERICAERKNGMNFDELYGSAKRLARKAAKRVSETADVASLQIKLSAAEGKLEEAYTLLGRAAYLHFSGEADESERVALAVKNVDAAREKVKVLKSQIALCRARAEQARKEEAEEE